MIICAAVQVCYENKDNIIICGHRHGDCFKVIQRLTDQNSIRRKVEGFITHEGTFLNREAAFQHALQCGQLAVSTQWYKKDRNDIELYSEDLY